MPPAQMTLNGANGSLHGRRQRLYDLHSYLRSVDNLRPDEALDEIAKLFELWARDRAFEGRLDASGSLLSERALAGAVERLGPIFESTMPGDGGDLFQELADVGVRSGMGQYFTPRPVAQAMAAFLAPAAGEAWLDPFCGSGLLLGALTERTGGLELFGIDRDPRVLHLARVEASLHHPDAPTKLLHANALEDAASLLDRLGAPSVGVDGIVANPPFGAEVHEADRAGYAEFELAHKDKMPLEVLGLEQSVAMLRDGGRLGIVLPQSILSNRSMERVRAWLIERCSIDGVLGLPGDTFGPFRGVGKASVLFATKGAPKGRGAVRLGISRSVGWDATGKPKGADDCSATAEAMRTGRDEIGRVVTVGQGPSLARNLTAEWLTRPAVTGRPIGELCLEIFTGRTPGRAAYEIDGAPQDSVYRVLKVADLTNHGVDWSVGERSLARLPQPKKAGRLVQVGDLATTAAAHHPRYIGAKVDYVDCEPAGYEGRCVPVAEVLVMRPDRDLIDPLVLLLWLRSAEGRAAVQSCVTGQTAHLHAADVAEIVVPERLFAADLADAVAAVRESLALRRRSEEAADLATRQFTAAADI